MRSPSESPRRWRPNTWSGGSHLRRFRRRVARSGTPGRGGCGQHSRAPHGLEYQTVPPRLVHGRWVTCPRLRGHARHEGWAPRATSAVCPELARTCSRKREHGTRRMIDRWRPSAPKGHNHSAQGDALGLGIKQNSSPEGAKSCLANSRKSSPSRSVICVAPTGLGLMTALETQGVALGLVVAPFQAKNGDPSV